MTDPATKTHILVADLTNMLSNIQQKIKLVPHHNQLVVRQITAGGLTKMGNISLATIVGLSIGVSTVMQLDMDFIIAQRKLN